MALENITTIVTDAGSALQSSNEYVWIFIILGGIIGTFLGVMLPYYRKRREFGKEGIDLIFDKDFLKTGAGALVISVVVVGALYPTLAASSDPGASYGSAFLAAASLAFTLNIGGNWIIGTNNAQAETLLIQKKAEQLVALRQIRGVPEPAAVSTVSEEETQPPKGALGGEGSVSQPGSSS
jgi:hypothetical protein